MRIFKGQAELPPQLPPSAVTIGNFDGVHRGHLAIIEPLIQRAEALGASPTVVTFDPHPQTVLKGEAPRLLCSPQAKLRRLEAAGIEQVVILDFDDPLQHTEPEEFLNGILLGRLDARAIVVGEGFRFGHMARGDVVMLRSESEGSYEFVSIPLTELKGRRLSSTEIRHAIAAGDLEWANDALGRPYSLSGEVVKGDGRGKEIGFPTANIRPLAGMVIPKMGIYAGRLTLSGVSHAAAISVGTKPTFGPHPIVIEAHLMDFQGEIYGEAVEAEFVAWLRQERAFGDVSELVSAMEEDVRQARKALGSG